MNRYKFFLMAVLLSGASLISACNKLPRPIEYGKDNCDFCQMTISDKRFGGEIVTQKGRVYKFDDLHCLKGFLMAHKSGQKEFYSIWLIDFFNYQHFIPADKSYLLYNPSFQSPMGANIVAFSDEAALQKYQSEHTGKEILWKDFLNSK